MTADFKDQILSSKAKLNQPVKDFLGPNGVFSKAIANFKVRKGQLLMAENWQDTIQNGEVLVCEAGTGTGKTFAYLIPAIVSGKCTLISTASKALQDQLVKKDLPALFELLNLQPNFMALKGFNNYLCLSKYHDLCDKFVTSHALKFDESSLDKDASFDDTLTDEQKLDAGAQVVNNKVVDEKTIAKLQLLVDRTEFEIAKDLPNIDFAEVNSKFPSNVVELVTCTTDRCRKKKCKYYDECYPFKARQKAIESKVVVINHSLFFSAAQIDNNFDMNSPCILLPKYKNLIIDEAHELPSVGREHLSLTVGSSDIKRLTYDIEFIKKHFKTLPIKPFEEAVKALKGSYMEVFSYLKKVEGNGENKRNFLYYKYEDYSEDNNDPYFEYQKVNLEFRQVIAKLYKKLRSTAKFFRDHAFDDDEFFDKIAAFIDAKANNITNLMNVDDKDNELFYGKYVGTVTVSRTSFSFSLTPLGIEEFMGMYFRNCNECRVSVLLTSATLSVDHKFAKYLTDVGLTKDTKAFEVEGSFNYPKQALLYTDENFPFFSDDNRIEKIVDNLKEVIDSVVGGVFFLTTSISSMQKAFICLSKYFTGKRKIYCQNRNLSNVQMLEKFKQDGKAILIGTSSFWAGVDVQGSALSLVIIDKLPFESPSEPMFRARCKFYDAKHKKSSFAAIAVPEAVIELRQGAGRLIRHESDFGALVICDPRIVNRNYGKIFMRSLPNMKPCATKQELIELLQNHQ